MQEDASQPHTQRENKVKLIYLVINYVNVLSPKRLVEMELRVWWYRLVLTSNRRAVNQVPKNDQKII